MIRFTVVLFTVCFVSSLEAAVVTRLVDDFESSSPNIGGTRTLINDAEIIEFGYNNQALRIKHRRGANFLDNIGGKAVYEFPTLNLFKPYGVSFDILDVTHTPGLTENAGFILTINDEFEYFLFIGPITQPRSYSVGFAGLTEDISIHNLTITASSQNNRFEFVIDNVAFFDTPPTVVPEATTVTFLGVLLSLISAKPLLRAWNRRIRRKRINYLDPQAVYGE